MNYTEMVRLTLEGGKPKLNSEEVIDKFLTNELAFRNLAYLVTYFVNY